VLEKNMQAIPPRNLAEIMDHTLLRPDANETEVHILCEDALQYDFKGVCVEKKWIPLVAGHLEGSSVLPVTVVAFPGGAELSVDKVDETKAALDLGAKEIDMVLNRGFLKAKSYGFLLADIRGVVEAAQGLPVKVILEISELTHDEIVVACSISKAAGAAFVKTSTGFSTSGATEKETKLMRDIVGKSMGVKASGGVRTYDDAVRMIHAGANRLGTSASVAIVKEAIVRMRGL
jgi:deoxyribose-phosphate aldolase